MYNVYFNTDKFGYVLDGLELGTDKPNYHYIPIGGNIKCPRWNNQPGPINALPGALVSLLALALVIPANGHLVLALVSVVPACREGSRYKVPLLYAHFSTWRYRPHVRGDIRERLATAPNTWGGP